LIPPRKPGGDKRTVVMREIVGEVVELLEKGLGCTIA
jgi:hypothetical protein